MCFKSPCLVERCLMKKQRLINDIILWLYSTNGHPNTEACTKVIISRIIKTLLCNYHDILIEVLIENNLLDIKSNSAT